MTPLQYQSLGQEMKSTVCASETAEGDQVSCGRA